MRFKKTRQTIKYNGIYLDCVGYYEPGEAMTYEYPGSSANFDVHEVFVDSTDIMDLLDDTQLEEIEVEVLDAIDDNDW
jgi:hypothetical protein